MCCVLPNVGFLVALNDLVSKLGVRRLHLQGPVLRAHTSIFLMLTPPPHGMFGRAYMHVSDSWTVSFGGTRALGTLPHNHWYMDGGWMLRGRASFPT